MLVSTTTAITILPLCDNYFFLYCNRISHNDYKLYCRKINMSNPGDLNIPEEAIVKPEDERPVKKRSFTRSSQ